jgi:phosphoglycerate dehydrogenase-like enzyme
VPSHLVLLSVEEGRRLFGTPPPGVEVAVWDGAGEPPEEVARTGFWVPQFLVLHERFAGVLERLPALQVVQLVTAGADAFIGRLPAGVSLHDARGVHGGPTSEWVLAVVLASVRELPRFVLAQQERRWDQPFTDELAGKRVLVVGAGDVGGQVRRKLEPFDVDVTMVARRAREGVHGVAELPALLPSADIVVVVVPLTDETRGLVDTPFLAAMHDGALLVNGARGPVADTVALTAELRSGRLRAALDVTDPEPPPADHPLWSAPGLLLTPHVAGSVPGFLPRAFALVRRQVERWIAGQPLENLVVDGY